NPGEWLAVLLATRSDISSSAYGSMAFGQLPLAIQQNGRKGVIRENEIRYSYHNGLISKRMEMDERNPTRKSPYDFATGLACAHRADRRTRRMVNNHGR